jgi:hypothetical protein
VFASAPMKQIPGASVVTTTAIATTAADSKVFETGRYFVAWISGLLDRRPLARIAWAVMAEDEDYKGGAVTIP